MLHVVTDYLAPKDIRSSIPRALAWTLLFALALVVTLLSMGALSYEDTNKDGKIARNEIHWDFKKITDNPDKKWWQIVSVVVFAIQTVAVPLAYYLEHAKSKSA